MCAHDRRASAGFTFPEVAFGLLVLVIAAAVLINHLSVNFQTTMSERDRVFAYSKAQAILSEVQGFVDRGRVDAAVDLDVLDDGIVNRPTLSITTDAAGQLVAPDHVLSGNTQRAGDWLWSRRISVRPFAGLNNRNVRYVTVAIFRRDANGIEQPTATLSAVINSAGSAFPTTQVFDVYLLALENVPGWWVYMDSIRPFVESSITDLETRNPGLEVRTHWITKASFGRNQVYRPYVNDARDSLQTIPSVYHYPGRMPAGSASNYYYVPDNMRARIDRDGTEVNGYHATRNPQPYALADFYNHAVRYPDELTLWQRRVDLVRARKAAIATARSAGTTPPAELDDMSEEPTWRMLLEDLYSNPNKYRNALLINLHGELLPMPALRNYSDAARDPENYPNVRVVTHPEQLRTARDPAGTNTEDVRLRVYAYTQHAPTYTGPQVLGNAAGTHAIAVEIMGMNLLTSSGALRPGVSIQNLPGGVMVAGSNLYATGFVAAKKQGDPLAANEMYYRAEYLTPAGGTPFTRIYLHNTPVVCPLDANNRGLAQTTRGLLYQMAYVPTPVEAARDFSRHLGWVSATQPKNTARWLITVPKTAFSGQYFVRDSGTAYDPNGDVTLTVRTRIWTGAGSETSGTMWPPSERNQPDNLSVTYTWWADDREDVPITERSQFQGDPRHNPYKDLCLNDADYPNGYNPYHDALNNSGQDARADYPTLQSTRLLNRWRGVISFDVPRFMEILRKGLVRSNCVYTSLTGFSYYYLGLGADIGYDAANGYPNSIPVERTPYGAPGTTGFANTITAARRFVRGAGNPYWWGMPWLGELYPDSVYTSQWIAADSNGNPRGNLNAGTAANTFFQGTMNAVYAGSNRLAFGTSLLDGHQRTANEGCTSLFNIGTSSSTFHHQSAAGTGTLTTVGREIAANYNLNMPNTAPISRPFGVATNATGTVGDEWNHAPYNVERYSASVFRTYYTHPNGNTGSGLVKLVDTGNTAAAYIVVNGIDATIESGTSFIAKFAVLSLVHSYFEAGSTANTLRIRQPPRVEIVSPTDITELNDPANIEIRCSTAWRRWDGLPYSASGTFGESEAELQYAVYYSNDGGDTWRHIADDSIGTPGERPPTGYLVADAGNGDEVFSWSVPASQFPQGSYQLRVDCFRQGATIHYSYHKTRIFIQR